MVPLRTLRCAFVVISITFLIVIAGCTLKKLNFSLDHAELGLPSGSNAVVLPVIP